jgi:mannose-6-phosphate isomerase-like protein (cupin superfamily)
MEFTIFQRIEEEIKSYGLSVASFDFERPWGGFFVIDEDQAQEFADVYFEGFDVDNLRVSGKLSPKILLVKPGSRLSWQYHHRRAETWKVIDGPVGIVISSDDNEREMTKYNNGDILVLQRGERHRLIGLDNWGVVAEFWQHTDYSNPSDEDDIVRVQDDYSRI